MPGKRLARARTRNGYTQTQLSQLTGISRDRLSRLERNRADPRIHEIRKLCDALNMSADWWLRNDTAPPDALKRKIDKLNTDQRRLVILIFDLLENQTESP